MISSVKNALNSKNKLGLPLISIFFISIVILLLIIQKPTLIYEWENIMPTLIHSGEFKYNGNFSAFMPPFYPYYLLFFQKLIGENELRWLSISILIHSIIFLLSVNYLLQLVLSTNKNTLIGQICLSSILFFPPILFGIVRNSSYALTTSIYILAFCFSYEFINSKKIKFLIFFLINSMVGLYLRWDFIAYFIIISFIIIINSKFKRSIFYFLIPFIFAFLTYLPWCFRNYEKLGKFTYNTSSAFNISKGNSLKFNMFKMNNSPDYGNNKTIIVGLAKKTEVERDNHLMNIVKDYIINNPTHFIKNSVGKLFINFTQYFPDSFGDVYKVASSSKAIIFTLLYSLFFIAYTVVLILFIIKYGLKKIFVISPNNYFFQFIIISFIFHFGINTFAAPPLPRYILFYFPFFTLFIFYSLFKQKKSITF